MKCLTVNTATKGLSIALTDGEQVLHLFEMPEMRDQGNVLLTHIKTVLSQHHLSFFDLDLLAVVTGPGSFTGIRAGLAAMRGIAMAADKPLIGVTSFDMFAVSVPGGMNIVAVESWREDLYFAVLDERGQALLEGVNETPEVFCRRVQRQLTVDGDVVVSGDAAEAIRAFFPQATVMARVANAVDAARKALTIFKEGGVFAKPVPYYLREADVTISPHASRTLQAREE